MMNISKFFVATLIDCKGVSSLEYSILAFSVIAAVSAAAATIAGPLSTAFFNIGHSL